MNVGVLDLGISNVGSVMSSLRRLGHEPWRFAPGDDLLKASHLIIPGVGSFGRGSAILDEYELRNALGEFVGRGNFLLGVCLGMQLLFNESTEGLGAGLGLIDGRCVRISDNSRVPHIGWAEPQATEFCPSALQLVGSYYFVHGYVVEPVNETVVWATVEHGGVWPAIVGQDNVWGAQFHPERSHFDGLMYLSCFLSQGM